MFAKIEITGRIEVVTGMHIGDSGAFSAIGAVDSPIIKDRLSMNPMIPGSSLKGKIRTLLAKQYNQRVANNPNEDCEEILDLFGVGNDQKNQAKASRLIFPDMIMDNWEELQKHGLTSRTEVKFENNIMRTSAVATPRQIERAVRGSTFPLQLIYEYKGDETLLKDMKMLADGFRLLEYDYLGGHGSRGYGKVKFSELLAEVVVGEVDDEVMTKCNQILQEGRS